MLHHHHCTLWHSPVLTISQTSRSFVATNLRSRARLFSWFSLPFFSLLVSITTFELSCLNTSQPVSQLYVSVDYSLALSWLFIFSSRYCFACFTFTFGFLSEALCEHWVGLSGVAFFCSLWQDFVSRSVDTLACHLSINLAFTQRDGQLAKCIMPCCSTSHCLIYSFPQL